MAPPDSPGPPTTTTPSALPVQQHAPPTDAHPPANDNPPISSGVQRAANAHNHPPVNTRPTNTPPPNTHTTDVTQQQENLVNIPDFNTARSADPPTYRDHIRSLHNNMAGGDTTDYHESRIALPRSLQGLKTGQVISRIMSFNPSIDTSKWASVTADIIGTNLVLGTINTVGKELIDGLGELKLEPGRASKVPPATKPNNLYHVELILPYERELHLDFLEVLFNVFTTAKYVSMPGIKPFGTTRRVRLYFNTTTAPPEVFTKEDSSIPIREITLPCGTAAPIIHKWQRLNQFRPPHLMRRWHQQPNPHSYAAAAATNTTAHPARFPPSQPYPPSTAQPPRPTRRPGAVPNGPPTRETVTGTPTANPNHPTASHENDLPGDVNMNDATHQTENWTSQDVFPPLTQPGPSPITPVTTSVQRHPPSLAAHNSNTPPSANTVHTNPEPTTDTTNTPHTPATTLTPQHGSTAPPQTPQTTPHQPHQPHTTEPQSDPPRSQQPSGTSNTTKEAQQWQQAGRSRSRKSITPTPHTNNQPSPALKRSTSRIMRSRSANTYTPLDFQILPSYEDDEITPIEITLPDKPIRPPRRKFRQTKKAVTKQTADALAHSQEIRHPANTLQHMSPKQMQVVLRTKDPTISAGREKLLRQIALLRAARNNTTEQNITLDPIADPPFIQQVQNRLAECSIPHDCDRDTPIDTTVAALLEHDDRRIRCNACYAWVDLASRAILPHLYDAWPDPPTWNGAILEWLTSTDGESPCLRDEALAMLAACPSLQNVWSHITPSAPDLDKAIRTAAAQWQSFKSS